MILMNIFIYGWRKFEDVYQSCKEKLSKIPLFVYPGLAHWVFNGNGIKNESSIFIYFGRKFLAGTFMSFHDSHYIKTYKGSQ